MTLSGSRRVSGSTPHASSAAGLVGRGVALLLFLLLCGLVSAIGASYALAAARNGHALGVLLLAGASALAGLATAYGLTAGDEEERAARAKKHDDDGAYAPKQAARSSERQELLGRPPSHLRAPGSGAPGAAVSKATSTMLCLFGLIMLLALCSYLFSHGLLYMSGGGGEADLDPAGKALLDEAFGRSDRPAVAAAAKPAGATPAAAAAAPPAKRDGNAAALNSLAEVIGAGSAQRAATPPKPRATRRRKKTKRQVVRTKKVKKPAAVMAEHTYTCRWLFDRYEASSWEKWWASYVPSVFKAPPSGLAKLICPAMRKPLEMARSYALISRVQELAHERAAAMEMRLANHTRPGELMGLAMAPGLDFEDMLKTGWPNEQYRRESDALFSRMYYELECQSADPLPPPPPRTADGAPAATPKPRPPFIVARGYEMLEPLVAHLRDPLTVCEDIKASEGEAAPVATPAAAELQPPPTFLVPHLPATVSAPPLDPAVRTRSKRHVLLSTDAPVGWDMSPVVDDAGKRLPDVPSWLTHAVVSLLDTGVYVAAARTGLAPWTFHGGYNARNLSAVSAAHFAAMSDSAATEVAQKQLQLKRNMPLRIVGEWAQVLRDSKSPQQRARASPRAPELQFIEAALSFDASSLASESADTFMRLRVKLSREEEEEEVQEVVTVEEDEDDVFGTGRAVSYGDSAERLKKKQGPQFDVDVRLAADVDKRPPEGAYVARVAAAPRVLLLHVGDVGASVARKDEQASAHLLAARMAAKGVHVDAAWVWAAPDTLDPEWTPLLPFGLAERTTFVRSAAVLDPESPANPWNVALAHARPTDLVLVRLCVGDSELQTALLQQLLQFPFLSTLVDELFVEHRVNLPELQAHWGESSATSKQDLHHTYSLYGRLRRFGIRVHGWA